jgi:hypothetical protein
VPTIEAVNMGTSVEEKVPIRTDSDEILLADYLQTAAPSALGTLIERHSSMVYSTCLRILGEVQKAEDATQATFLVGRHAGHIPCLCSQSPVISTTNNHRHVAVLCGSEFRARNEAR